MDDTFAFNGIDGSTGAYLLPPMPAAQVAAMAQGFGPDDEQQQELDARRFGAEPSYGVKEGVDPNDLAQSGWGVVFARGADPALKDALGELLAHRQGQAGDRFRLYEGDAGYRPGETKDDFLTRHGAGPGPADPDRVPYYLLLVGDPEAIPWRVQYQLDVQYAVGRLHFPALEAYASYARSVVAAETEGAARPRRAVFFGVRNEGDRATQLSADDLVRPLATELGARFGAGEQPWAVELVEPAGATKTRLRTLLGGADTPTLLFTASHGVGFPATDRRQPTHQGALLCQDWPGPDFPELVTPETWLAADDIGDDAHPLGLVAFHFACYGAGTPRLDDFPHLAQASRQSMIARRGFVAPLPRRLLGHPKGGALAVVSHVERAWPSSIRWGEAGPQIGAFRDTIHRLLDGHRVGSALEPLNARYAELSSDLNEVLERARFGQRPDARRLGEMWTSNNDARAYAVIGDPAVRLVTAVAASAGAVPEIAPVGRITTAPVAPPAIEGTVVTTGLAQQLDEVTALLRAALEAMTALRETVEGDDA